MKLAIAALAALAFAAPAYAQVDEVRVGIGKSDLAVIGDIPSLDPAVAINAEVIFDKPASWTHTLAPRLYTNGQLNLGGGASWIGGGATWRQGLGDTLYADFGIGLVVHDGILDAFDEIEPGQTFLDALFIARNNREYGSRVLVREQVTLGARLNEAWAAEAYFEHVSHGNIWTDAKNDGSDSGGIRLSRRF